MYADRLVEFVNMLQKRRNSCHAAFESALQFTPDLPALMHAHAAYEAAVLGASHAEDPIRASTHHEVAKLVAKFVELLGTDLTVASPLNPFWHTGNPIQPDAADLRKAKPWDYVWRVASARAFGKDRATLETVSAWAERHIAGAF